MKKLTDFLKNFAIDYVIKYLTDNKDEVVKKLNKEINLPILSESQEKELLEKPNEADEGVKEIKQLLVSKDLKIHELEMRVDNYENQLLELAKKVDKIKK